MIREADTQDGYLARISREFSVSRATACVYLARARKEIGEAVPLDGAEFDLIFVEGLLQIATDESNKPSERRKAFEALAKFLGRFKQLAATEAIVPASPPTPSLRNDAILIAALALDEAVNSPDSR